MIIEIKGLSSSSCQCIAAVVSMKYGVLNLFIVNVLVGLGE